MGWRLKSPASRLFTQPFIQRADQRKHQSSASLAFVPGIHRWPVNSPHKEPVTRKMFPFPDVIMTYTVETELANTNGKVSDTLSNLRQRPFCIRVLVFRSQLMENLRTIIWMVDTSQTAFLWKQEHTALFVDTCSRDRLCPWSVYIRLRCMVWIFYHFGWQIVSIFHPLNGKLSVECGFANQTTPRQPSHKARLNLINTRKLEHIVQDNALNSGINTYIGFQQTNHCQFGDTGDFCACISLLFAIWRLKLGLKSHLFAQPFVQAQVKKHQSSESLAFVRRIHRGRPKGSPHRGPVTRKLFPFDGVIINEPIFISWCWFSRLYTQYTNFPKSITPWERWKHLKLRTKCLYIELIPLSITICLTITLAVHNFTYINWPGIHS